MVVKFLNWFDPCRCRLFELCSYCKKHVVCESYSIGKAHSSLSDNLEAIGNLKRILLALSFFFFFFQVEYFYQMLK